MIVWHNVDYDGCRVRSYSDCLACVIYCIHTSMLLDSAGISPLTLSIGGREMPLDKGRELLI